MTNEKIILLESIRLMEEGILKSTGEKIVVEYDNGTTRQVDKIK